MKKIFTFVMLSILTVMNVNAAEETLWTGDWYVTWNGTDGHNEWGNYNADESLNQDFAWAFVEGAKINVYLEANEMKDGSGEIYHKAQFDDWDWAPLPGLSAVEFSGNKTITIEVTADIATAVAAKGFRIHGHGFNVVKMTQGEIEGDDPVVDIDDLEESVVLWAGEQEISGWGSKCLVMTNESEGFSMFKEKVTKACNLYVLVEPVAGSDFRISGQWGAWGDTAYPANDYNHMQAIDGDNVVKVALDADFVANAFTNEGGFAFWGDGGFKVKKIGTTKDAVIGTTGLNIIAAAQKNDGKYYNLLGQVVDQPTNGLYIINGKKVILK